MWARGPAFVTRQPCPSAYSMAARMCLFGCIEHEQAPWREVSNAAEDATVPDLRRKDLGEIAQWNLGALA